MLQKVMFSFYNLSYVGSISCESFSDSQQDFRASKSSMKWKTLANF